MPFSDILGQDKGIEVIRRSLAAGKIAHAYLFHGPDGCGKRKTALAFVEALFCGKDEGCGACRSCRKVASLQHPDLHLMEPEGAVIKVDQVRELQREFALRPFEAPRKACIIEGAERMNPAAANALLKTLEEPPGSAVLILLAANCAAVLPTILSRCQQLRFSPLSQETIETLLAREGAGPDTVRLAASLAEGSMRKALDVAGGAVLHERKSFIEAACAFSLTDIAPLFATAEELAKEKEKALDILEMFKSFLRDTLLLLGGQGAETVNSDLLPLLRREAARHSMEKVMERIDCVGKAQEALLRNVNPRLALEVLFMRLASM